MDDILTRVFLKLCSVFSKTVSAILFKRFFNNVADLTRLSQIKL